MTKDRIRQAIATVYDNCLDYEELELRRLEMIDLNEKLYQLEKSYRMDMEDFKNV